MKNCREYDADFGEADRIPPVMEAVEHDGSLLAHEGALIFNEKEPQKYTDRYEYDVDFNEEYVYEAEFEKSSRKFDTCGWEVCSDEN